MGARLKRKGAGYKVRPVPTNPEEWMREYVGIARLIASLEQVHLQHRTTWRAGMLKYYRFRRRTMLKNKPAGVRFVGGRIAVNTISPR